MKSVAPQHPGSILHEELKRRGLTVGDAATLLEVGRPSLSRTLNGHYAITPNLAVKLEAIRIGSNAESWLILQMWYDLWEARKHAKATKKTLGRRRKEKTPA